VIRHIVHVNINVSDIERSVEFYRLLGFELMHVLADEPTDDLRQLMHFGGRWILRRSRKACFPRTASAFRAWRFGPRT
jgi:catechol 2,3-dioxygenase-like lactoylglutathione lyase family enzyme